MKSNHQFIYTLALQAAVVFSSLLLSIGGFPNHSLKSAEVGLAQLSMDLQIQSKVKSEVERTFASTRVLLGLSLIIVTVFPVIIVGLFWFLRRAVIGEIVDRAIEQIHDLEDLQSQLTMVKDTAEKSIRRAKNITSELTTEIGTLQHQINREKGNLAVVSSDVIDAQKKLLLELEAQAKETEVEIANLELEVGNHVEKFYLCMEQQRDSIVENSAQLLIDTQQQISDLQMNCKQEYQQLWEDIQPC